MLGPKARHAAETYVLALFQLYPTVYFHKATRGAEVIFTALMVRLVRLTMDGSYEKSGLPKSHPFIRFASKPDEIENILHMDDSVFWGALPLLVDATDPLIAQYARRLFRRQLLKSIDVREMLYARMPLDRAAPLEDRRARDDRVAQICVGIVDDVAAWNDANPADTLRILVDQATRNPYKRFQDSKVPLNQIHIRVEGGQIRDVAEQSPVVAGLEPFHLFRVYIDRQDADAEKAITQMIEGKLGGKANAKT